MSCPRGTRYFSYPVLVGGDRTPVPTAVSCAVRGSTLTAGMQVAVVNVARYTGASELTPFDDGSNCTGERRKRT